MKLSLTQATATALVCLPLAFGAVYEAQAADVVYNNGVPDNSNAILAGRFGPGNDVLQAADNFTLSQTTQITDVHWWGIYTGTGTTPTVPVPDAFSAFLFSNNSGQPGTFLDFRVLGAPTATPTGNLIAGFFPVYSYSVDIAPLTLNAGTYWLSVYNDADKSWAWAQSAPSGNSYQSSTGLDWIPTTPQRELAFNLTGTPVVPNVTVPEPSLTIVGLAIVGAAGAALKRKEKE